MRQRASTSKAAFVIGATMLAMLAGSCLPAPPSESQGLNLTVYGFSIMKESLEKAVYPGFSAKWKSEHGQEVNFTSSFAGSETITNQILQGVKAEIAILSIERDADRLKQGGFVTSDWHTYPQKGVINKTPFVILVRKGNPKGINDFADLAKPGVKLIHPDPVSSGGAQWSVLAIYGSELVKSEKQSGEPDQARALQMLRAVWRNVISTPGSAREARTQLETGHGDALITYELEGLIMKQAGAPIEVEIVVPQATILSEHPAVVVDRNVPASKRPVVEAFMQYLWSEEAQGAFVQYHFRSVTNENLNQENSQFAQIEMPFTIDYFGGWSKAYPDVIEKVFRDQVQRRK
ncbi:MAG TPA: sulfate ABC transporter substrate-binding protein [Pyrinomonadaceae bacterium]|nr:sulfate ABC transporter substrate-binding protein [Pyrinomonadaceae bacterium]